ncbi:unnamed protein product [Paramecium primaurelia]|uniref:Uncharacterized protein n=2 Tax=Paramecium TaxID=5884 RepID=A0A8S1T4C9_9CILI|nr:unnamed protein product [Paramecium primaurelia]CAD8146728.1 unnamed protein product [Paramecium pentaurelia]
MYQIFRTMKMMKQIIRPIRMCTPIIATNNYLNIYNLNQFFLSMSLSNNDDDLEALNVNQESDVRCPQMII